MSVSVPRERCYYYECSHGDVRLTYFIPAAHVKKMIRENKISKQVITDFPDGVDLDCTAPDFNEFRKEYGFIPEYSAEELQQAFYAIFSSTKGWSTYRGTGLIHAAELEAKIPEVKQSLSVPEDIPDEDEKPSGSFREQYKKRIEAVALTAQNKKELRELILRGIDQRKQIHEQMFRPIRMSEGKKPEEIFSLLQQNKQ